MVNHIYKDLQQSPSIFTLILLVEALSSCLWVELRGVPTPRKGLLERLFIHCQGREFQAGITGLVLLYADFFCAQFSVEIVILVSPRCLWVPKRLKAMAVGYIFTGWRHWKIDDVSEMYMWDFSGGTVVGSLPANAGDMGRSLVRVDSTCLRATKPLHHNYWALELWATTPEPVCQNFWGLRAWSRCSTIREGTTIRNPHITVKNSPCSLQIEKAHTQQ